MDVAPEDLEIIRSLGYKYRTSLNVKVLDFVKHGGPKLTVGRTVFELWLGLDGSPKQSAKWNGVMR